MCVALQSIAMFRGILLALSTFIAVTAGAKEKPEEILKNLPEVIGAFKREGDLHTYPYAELGVSAAYGAGGTQITLYVYDHGLKDIQPGIEHPGVKQSFDMAQSDIRAQYLNVEPVGTSGTVLPSGGKLLSVEYRLTYPPEKLPGNVRVYSSIHLAGARGHIVKVRTTGPVDQEEEIRKKVNVFVTELFEKLNKAGDKTKGQ